MIYRFMYQNPPKATRSASMALRGTAKDLSIIAKAAYQAKYGTDMVADGYTGYLLGAGDPGADADGGAKGPEPDEFDDGKPTLYHYNQGDEVTNPDHYNQGMIDVIEGLYQMLPFEQFRGFMKGNIIKYTVRYEHKGHGKDLDKVEEYKHRLKEYERKEKML